MNNSVTLYSGGIGINNKVASHRLLFDQESGVSAFEDASNVVIGRTGEVSTRRGVELIASGDYHSNIRTIDGFYAVMNRSTDSAIYKFVPNPDGSLESYGIRSGLTHGAKMSFAKIGDGYLYCNGYENGIIVDDVSDFWPRNIWTGPNTTVSMTDIPVGQRVAIFNGRALVSVDNEIFYSEHGLVGLVDELGSRVRMESKVIMMCPVQTGIFVSDLDFVYFISGNNPKEWICKKVLNYPAIEWAQNDGLINPSNFGLNSFDLSCLFGTTNGPVVGMPDGTAVNLIEKNVSMPIDCVVNTGSIMVVDETMVIQSGA